jgi:hypothetical protein
VHSDVSSCSVHRTFEVFLFLAWQGGRDGGVLVFPAASRPSIKSRISLDPKILFIIFDIDAPILSVVRYTDTLNYGIEAVFGWFLLSSPGMYDGAEQVVVLIAP